MRIIYTCLAVFLAWSGSGVAQSQNDASPVADNPILNYLIEIDDMGRTLSGWQGEQEELTSWFFGAYAMLMLSNKGKNDLKPFPGLGNLIPRLWGDLKYLSPRDLIEITGGTLSGSNLMSSDRGDSFQSKSVEEQLIIIVAGYSYLRMLYGHVGDEKFREVIASTMNAAHSPELVNRELSESVKHNCGEVIGAQFSEALGSGSWMDVGIGKVKVLNDSTQVYINQYGTWSFPVKILIVSDIKDSSYVNYSTIGEGSIMVPGTNIRAITLDPDHELAEFYRFNNHWPKFKNNFHIQPFFAIPDWESYPISISPGTWSDWDGDKRYSLKISAGNGVNLWPAYPSDFRHRILAEVNSHQPVDSIASWGARVNYEHPVSFSNRLFVYARIHSYDDWSGYSVGFTKYLGKQRFLIEGPRLLYQRLSASLENDRYGEPLVWETSRTIHVARATYTGLSLTRYGDRLYVKMTSATGREGSNNFSIGKAQVDLSGVFFKWLVGGFHFVYGTQSRSTPGPYTFSQDYAWQDNVAALPNFRGQNQTIETSNNYMGLNISSGYWMSWYQAKVFASSMLYDQADRALYDAEPRYAAGFGFEHKSLFTLGLYFPVWQSHPLEGEEPWAWRHQWRLSWNL